MANILKTLVNSTTSAIECYCGTAVYGSITLCDIGNSVGPLNTVFVMKKAEEAFFKWVKTGVTTPKISSFFSVDDMSKDVYLAMIENHYWWEASNIVCYNGAWYTSGFSCALIKSTLHGEKIFIMDYFTKKDLVPFKLGERNYVAEQRPRTLIMFASDDGIAHWATEICHSDPRIEEISPKEFREYFYDRRRTDDAVRHIQEVIRNRSFMKLLVKEEVVVL